MSLIESSGEFNGDGKSDLVWQNTSGAISVWTMDGADLLGDRVHGPYGGWGAATAANLSVPINGDAGNNTLAGTLDNDTIFGRGGNDVLTGRAGRDTFVYRSGESGTSNADHITDFTAGPEAMR